MKLTKTKITILVLSTLLGLSACFFPKLYPIINKIIDNVQIEETE